LLAASFMNDWVVEHIAGHHPRSQGGFGAPPSGPGLGVEVDRRSLRLLFAVGEQVA
jgi:L-alanine-DL-glutamate epimerase-like enolase superfamily enzyme